ncbi:ThuA domain-containing protein [Pricia sp. S334]|uniref:ThuA domain-containing protein n=1 Tax=Pricia mediterranea TaxID=3076079 RepID=A0ABU3L711_9FLAO|nr:ThuA domain-containing protein [Pricia sp. S334]MDT7829353.1 ThuA domain-containing protein [Pricia sp. S334]
MKKLLYIFVCCTLFACKEDKKSVAETVQQEEPPKEQLVFEGDGPGAKNIVLISGDEEYRSEEALPQLAKILSEHHGFNCTVLFAQDPDNPGIVDANYVNNIPGLEALDKADMMVVFTRFRALPDEQMKHIDDYLMAGKPVMGIRTATHAFMFPEDSESSYRHYGNYYNGDRSEWQGGFGRLVLGEHWIAHHGHHRHQSQRGMIFEDVRDHPITNGIEDGDVWGASDVYEVRLPLPGDAEPLLYGQVMNRKGDYDETDIHYGMRPSDDEVAKVNNEGKTVNDVKMPIAWTKSYQLPGGEKGRAFTTTVGAASDMLIEGTRRLLVNGVFWSMDLPVPEKADVSLVGDFEPTRFEFRDEGYYQEKGLKVGDFYVRR